MQRAQGKLLTANSQIGLTVALAWRPSDLVAPFSGFWLPVGWCVVTEEEEPGLPQRA